MSLKDYCQYILFIESTIIIDIYIFPPYNGVMVLLIGGGNMHIGSRIKQVRKECKKTQQVFADALGLKRNTIANYEIGQIQPSDRTIADICRLFNVSEVWLREGEGEMFIQLDEDEQLIEVLTRVELEKDTPFVDMMTAALKSYYKLDDSQKAVVNQLIDGMLAEISAQKKAPDSK